MGDWGVRLLAPRLPGAKVLTTVRVKQRGGGFRDAIASFGNSIGTFFSDSWQAIAKTGNDIPKNPPSSNHRPSADSRESIDLPVLGNDVQFAG